MTKKSRYICLCLTCAGGDSVLRDVTTNRKYAAKTPHSSPLCLILVSSFLERGFDYKVMVQIPYLPEESAQSITGKSQARVQEYQELDPTNLHVICIKPRAFLLSGACY